MLRISLPVSLPDMNRIRQIPFLLNPLIMTINAQTAHPRMPLTSFYCSFPLGGCPEYHKPSFSLSSPESYGITEVPISLGSISSQAANENRAALENTTAALKRFDREKLSKTRQLTYDILSDYLAMEQKGTDFSLYEEYLNPSSALRHSFQYFMKSIVFPPKMTSKLT